MLEVVIGIEVHVELKSNSKVFSHSQNEYSQEPNIYVNEIDLGYPGVLPVLNKKVIEMALQAALALNCNINKVMHFDRKNYFYPDLPKGYQITEQDTPIGYDGHIDIGDKKIGIERLHIEEDTCKSIHGKTGTLLDANRAGVPLIEIVSKPDMRSPEEAVKYLTKLREILLYLGISDVKIEEGSMRCDVNVSVSDSDKLGTKCEVKNIGSISNVGLAIDYEIKRQTEELNSGKKIIEQTNPSSIHFMNYDLKYFDEEEFLKTVYGMLKFANNNNNGKVELRRCASFLGKSYEVFYLLFSILEDCGIINIIEKNSDYYVIEIAENHDLSLVIQSEKYNELADLISECEEFQKSLLEDDLYSLL